jgi:AbrB family looped-hinge helix DNA binding protein
MGSPNARLSRISPKGWVVIPAALRRRLGLTPGTTVRFEEVDGKLVISKPEFSFREARGMLPVEPSLTEELLAERLKDREREESEIRAG